MNGSILPPPPPPQKKTHWGLTLTPLRTCEILHNNVLHKTQLVRVCHKKNIGVGGGGSISK